MGGGGGGGGGKEIEEKEMAGRGERRETQEGFEARMRREKEERADGVGGGLN